MCGDGCHAEDGAHEGCCLSGGAVRGFLQPRIVLLLLERPAHGYELMERLAEDAGLPGADPGLLYRTLRGLERDGFLVSRWDTAGQGPARRRYEVTPDGVAFLHAWAAQLRQMRAWLGDFIRRYEAYVREHEEG